MGGKLSRKEWTSTVTGELKAAGFEVSEYAGFPLVKEPEQIEQSVRLLKFQTSLATERQIYAEGMLFLPAGAWRMRNSGPVGP